MSFSAAIETGIDRLTARWRGLEKKRMFGGLCYLLHGNMCFGVYRDFLIVRLGEERAAAEIAAGRARPFDITGRPMKGWVMVGGEQLGREDSLKEWLAGGKSAVRSLPPRGPVAEAGRRAGRRPAPRGGGE